jgi:GH15 family glucan-1,4-alpha-glucosidase
VFEINETSNRTRQNPTESPPGSRMSLPIEDYAMIGDGESAALVARNGSIDWLCWPCFDSDACFAALLGTGENGCWRIAPDGPVRSVLRRYAVDTLVLETEHSTDQGSVRVIDFMPMRDGASCVIRIVEGLAGSVAMRMDMWLRFNYGTLPPWVEPTDGGLIARIGPDMVVLRTSAPVHVEPHAAHANFTVAQGQRTGFVLSYCSSWEAPPSPVDAEAALMATLAVWRDWIGRFDNSKTRWPQAVRRSLITLKALVHGPSGGLIAAPTTSLPEAPGGTMNWDYRFSWLRDSAFTLGALMNAGFVEEATNWRDWLLRAVAGSPEQMRIMYRVDGSRHLNEWTVAALPGYRDALPVRIGNAASTQHQIDVLGEVLDALSLARRAGIPGSDQEAKVAAGIVHHLEATWQSTGSGIWESRAAPRNYTYSKVMAWVGVDRFVRHYKETPDADGDRIRRLTTLRQEIHDDVCRNGWNPGLGTFTQYYGGQEIDASLLLMPLVGFLPADEPRMASTIENIARHLGEGGLIRRTRSLAGGPAEGAFLPCAFWMADCLNLQGRHAEACAQFERVLAVCNDVGLLSEEYNVPGRHLSGNFPQALTHLALVNSALGLCGPTLSRGGG